LRLAVVSPFVDRSHGTERALCELLERLARNYGCEIHLYSQRVADLAVADSDVARAPRAGAIFWHRVPSLPGPHLVQFVGWILLNSVIRWWQYSFRSPSIDLVLSPGLNCLNADVIVVHAVFRRLHELSVTHGSRNVAGVAGLRSLHRKAYYALLTWLERRTYSNRKVSLVAVSARTASQLEKYFRRSDAYIALNGVDTAQFSAAERLNRRTPARAARNFRDDEFVLLVIGNDWRIKGLPAILEALAAQPARNLRLIVVGSDDGTAFFELADRLGVLSRCVWESPPADILELYAAADVYVSPTLEDSFGMPVTEAMACGLPVITSVFAGVSPQIQHGIDGFVLQNPQDSQALAEILERLQSDPEFAGRIGAAAATKAQDWTWDRNAAAIWDVLERVVDKGNRRRQNGNLA
jgi:UDP-glucose:(heptosyl)LPS alpha-1,3-glucosyltransferase